MTNEQAKALYIREIDRLSWQYPYLKDWKFGYIRKGASRRLGVCCYGPKIIKLNQDLLAQALEAEILDTILHEIAHVIAPVKYGLGGKGHGWGWKAVCREIGAKPERCADVDIEVEGAGKWVLRHKKTGEIFRKYAGTPRRKSLSGLYIKGRKGETLGMLEVVLANTPLGESPETSTAPAPSPKPKGRWIVRHKETGEVFKHYRNFPRTSDWSTRYISGRKRQTLGMLEVVLEGTPVREAAKLAAQDVLEPIKRENPPPPGFRPTAPRGSQLELF